MLCQNGGGLIAEQPGQDQRRGIGDADGKVRTVGVGLGAGMLAVVVSGSRDGWLG